MRVVKPASDARGIVSVKDPSVVRHNDRWQYLCDHGQHQWALGHGLPELRGLGRRGQRQTVSSGPESESARLSLRAANLLFPPAQKWYLIYQSGQPQYSTADDLTKPETPDQAG